MKICFTCQIEKDDSEFPKQKSSKSGVSGRCIICTRYCGWLWKQSNKEKIAQSQRDYRGKKPKKLKVDPIRLSKEEKKKRYKALHKKYYINNKDIINQKRLALLEVKRPKRKAYGKEYRGRPEVKARTKELYDLKRKNDPVFKLKSILRCRLRCILKANSLNRLAKSEELLGISYLLFKTYIERQFKKGMTWENHGNSDGSWQIDHKIPLKSAKTEDELRLLFHYTNCQPLWRDENIRKKDTILPTQMSIIL